MKPLVQLDTGLRILIVDDMPAVRDIVREMLENQGVKKVREAESAEVAWDILQNETTNKNGSRVCPFDLLIVDWSMPGMSGVDFLRAIRTAPATREIPFVMITGEGDEARFVEAFREGATEFIVKPFGKDELLSKIHAALTS